MHSSEDINDFPVRQRDYSSRRRDGAGHDGRLLYAPCQLVAFLLCLTKMKPRSRIILTWFYTIICACVTGSLVAKYHYKNDLAATATDMRKIDMVSTSFCESVTVKSTVPITTRKFYKPPTISDSTSLYYFRVSTSLNWNQYQFWGFYLLKGSKITVHACGRAYLYKIIGGDKLNDWVDGSRRESFDGPPVVISDCLEGLYPTIVDITATKSAQYYLLFHYDQTLGSEQPNKVNADFILKRKYYNIMPNVSDVVCLKSVSCTVPLAADSKETVAYIVPNYDNLNEISITSHCKPRVFMYLIVFGALPFLVGMFFTCMILKLARKHARDRDRGEPSVFTVSGNEESVLDGYINQNFRLQLSPPSYDEAQASCSASIPEAPPSYDEAIRQGNNNMNNNNSNSNENNNNNNNDNKDHNDNR